MTKLICRWVKAGLIQFCSTAFRRIKSCVSFRSWHSSDLHTKSANVEVCLTQFPCARTLKFPSLKTKIKCIGSFFGLKSCWSHEYLSKVTRTMNSCGNLFKLSIFFIYKQRQLYTRYTFCWNVNQMWSAATVQQSGSFALFLNPRSF